MGSICSRSRKLTEYVIGLPSFAAPPAPPVACCVRNRREPSAWLLLVSAENSWNLLRIHAALCNLAALQFPHNILEFYRQTVLLERFVAPTQQRKKPNKAFGTARMVSGVPILWTIFYARLAKNVNISATLAEAPTTIQMLTAQRRTQFPHSTLKKSRHKIDERGQIVD